jgi:PAS domain S-box-containing protein
MTDTLLHDQQQDATGDSLDAALHALQIKACALSADVARRQQAQAAMLRRDRELSDFLDNAAVGLHRVGPDGVILWANRFELDLLGYEASEYIGRPITDFHVERQVIDGLVARLLSGETIDGEISTVRCKDGSVRQLAIHSNALFVDGKFVSTRCISHDVTEKLRLERELDHRLAELADLDRRKDEFLAMLGHELRNPLAPMMSALDLMAMHESEPVIVGRARQVIQRQADLMHRLINDLLDVSRITQGKIELQLRTVPLADSIARAIELVQPLLQEKGIAFTANLPGRTHELHVDPERLTQAVANLLNNAVKFTERGGRVALDVQVDGKQLVIVVSDDGIGLDSDMQKRVFDIFVQEKSPLAQVRGGLGLGLTLVRSIAELHGGTAEVTSAGRGQGSAFSLRLPVVLRSPADGMEAGAAGESAPREQGVRRVLVVDDNRDAAELLGELLTAFGHEAHVVYSGAEALDVAHGLQPDFAILDIGMPGMDGYETCQRLRSECGLGATVFIALTGYTQKEDQALAQRSGFHHHLPKPVDFARLQELLGGT